MRATRPRDKALHPGESSTGARPCACGPPERQVLCVERQLDGAPYAVLELVPGEDLQRMLLRQGL
jgi:hypothetical protein